MRSNVGVMLSLDLELKGSPAEAKHQILNRFKADPNKTLHLYRLVNIDDDAVIEKSENIVVTIPGSKLTCEAIDELIETNQIQNQTISELQTEITNLKRKLAQSDSVRQEALGTVNQLRTEFIHLIEELTPRTCQVASSGKSSGETSNRMINPSVPRNIPKLKLSNIRN